MGTVPETEKYSLRNDCLRTLAPQRSGLLPNFLFSTELKYFICVITIIIPSDVSNHLVILL